MAHLELIRFGGAIPKCPITRSTEERPTRSSLPEPMVSAIASRPKTLKPARRRAWCRPSRELATCGLALVRLGSLHCGFLEWTVARAKNDGRVTVAPEREHVAVYGFIFRPDTFETAVAGFL